MVPVVASGDGVNLAIADAAVWGSRLRALAEPTLRDAAAPDPAVFRDEFGHRRPADGAFLAWRVGREAPAGSPADPEAVLWRLVADGLPGAAALVGRWADAPRGEADRGSLFPQAQSPAIEVWTEAELCGLHALWWLARGDASLRPVLDRAAAWHIGNIQPDNATHRPWAVHVFLLMAIGERRPDALLHAQGLIHGSLLAFGRPDVLSAHILADAADALDEASGVR